MGKVRVERGSKRSLTSAAISDRPASWIGQLDHYDALDFEALERSAWNVFFSAPSRRAHSSSRGQSRLKKAFRASFELSLLKTSTSLGVRRKSPSTIGCISPSNA
jgi:hypothetical protein